MRVRSSIRSYLPPIIRSLTDGGSVSGIPGRRFLLAYWDDSTAGSVGLTVADYALVGSEFQDTFFTDADTPITNTVAEWTAILSVHESINLLNVIGTEAKGWAVYRDDTSRELLNKALRWFGLPIVVPEVTNLDDMLVADIDDMTVAEIDQTPL